MKKITLLLMTLVCFSMFSQRTLTPTTVSVNGDTPIPYDMFLEDITRVITPVDPDAFDPPPTERLIIIGTSYTFTFDYTNQPEMAQDTDGVTLIPNRVRVATFNPAFSSSFGSIDSDTTINGDGTISVTFTPAMSTDDAATDEIEFGVLQFRTYQSFGGLDNDDNNDTADNTFIFNLFILDEDPTLSTNDFSKDSIASAISQKDGIVTIADTVETEDYKLYDMTGALVIEKEADGIIDINGLPNGVYILSTDAGLTKIGK